MNGRPIRLAIVGATGSVGSSVLDICRRFPDKFEVRGAAAGANEAALLDIVETFGVRYACLSSPEPGADARARSRGALLLSGEDGLIDLVRRDDIDHVVFASSGTDAITALAAALEADKDVSLANKESIVAAGPWIMPLVRRRDQLRPLDSEHSAVWQCMRDEPHISVRSVILTASGGPFRSMTMDQLAVVTPEDALKHPVWSMGAKITIDSATLMNKGIECIEAMRMFDLPNDRVRAVIHPKSLVHAIVEFEDGASKMLLSRPDMRLPSAAALAWPERLELVDAEEAWEMPAPWEWRLEFFEPDEDRFPCLRIAREASAAGDAYPPLIVGADEAAVGAFLERRISFTAIPRVIEGVMERYRGSAPSSIAEAIAIIDEGRRGALALIAERFGGDGGSVHA